MKYFNWNNEKNEKLRKERGVSFEEVVLAIEQGQLLDILEHPNKDKYDNQDIFVIKLYNYVWLVPFVENENEVFVKINWTDSYFINRIIKHPKLTIIRHY